VIEDIKSSAKAVGVEEIFLLGEMEISKEKQNLKRL